MRRPSLARFLAPLALAAAIAAVFYVVNHSDVVGSDKKPAASATTKKAPVTGKARKKARRKRKASTARTYRVRAGDTLSKIALRTGVQVAVIEELNPGLDPQTLTVGLKIKLKP
jgi:LysM repeat protein